MRPWTLISNSLRGSCLTLMCRMMKVAVRPSTEQRLNVTDFCSVLVFKQDFQHSQAASLLDHVIKFHVLKTDFGNLSNYLELKMEIRHH